MQQMQQLRTMFAGMVIIFDMDGTLANIEERVKLAVFMKSLTDKKMNWDVFLNSRIMELCDVPNQDVVDLARLFHSIGAKIIIVSARNERHRAITAKQLFEWGVPFEKLYLRKDGDFRNDGIVKEEILATVRQDGYNPILAVDDRQQVVDTWVKLGITCWQVRQTQA